MPTINAASTPSRNVTTRAENMELRLDYENEFQFQFQLEIVSSQVGRVNNLKIQAQNGNGRTKETGRSCGTAKTKLLLVGARKAIVKPACGRSRAQFGRTGRRRQRKPVHGRRWARPKERTAGWRDTSPPPSQPDRGSRDRHRRSR